MLESKLNSFKVGKIILNYKPKREGKPEAKRTIREAIIHTMSTIYNLVPSPSKPTASLRKSLWLYLFSFHFSNTYQMHISLIWSYYYIAF